MVFAVIRLGIASLALAPLLIALYALAMGIVTSARKESHEGDRLFLFFYAAALLFYAMMLIVVAEALSHVR